MELGPEWSCPGRECPGTTEVLMRTGKKRVGTRLKSMVPTPVLGEDDWMRLAANALGSPPGCLPCGQSPLQLGHLGKSGITQLLSG